MKNYAIAVWILVCAGGLALAGLHGAERDGTGELTAPFLTLQASVASDTVSIKDVARTIVGTWLEDTRQKNAQPQEWVFVKDGELKQYVNDELYQAVTYKITERCEDSFYGTLEVAPRQVAMLELTHTDGTTSCKYIMQWVDNPPERSEYFTLGTERDTAIRTPIGR
jgi:hypothetical protein